MKVVFDTNVFVWALTLPDGRGAQALRKSCHLSEHGEDSFGGLILAEVLRGKGEG